MAVLDEHPRKFAVLHGHGDSAARMESINILATALPRRHIAETSVASEDLAFFEMNVNRVIPTSPAIDKCPDLASAHLGRSRNLVVVGREALATISSDRPRSVVCAVGSSELESAFPSHRNLRQIRVWNYGASNFPLITFIS